MLFSDTKSGSNMAGGRNGIYISEGNNIKYRISGVYIVWA